MNCIFCNYNAPSLSLLKTHSAMCGEHPAVKRAEAAEGLVFKLRTALKVVEGDKQFMNYTGGVDTPTCRVVREALRDTPASVGAELGKLRGYYTDVVKFLGHDLVVKEIETLRAQLDVACGEANYRLKYLAAVCAVFGVSQLEDETPSAFAGRACEILRQRLGTHAALIGWVQPRIDEWKSSGRGMCAFGRERMEALEDAMKNPTP